MDLHYICHCLFFSISKIQTVKSEHETISFHSPDMLFQVPSPSIWFGAVWTAVPSVTTMTAHVFIQLGFTHKSPIAHLALEWALSCKSVWLSGLWTISFQGLTAPFSFIALHMLSNHIYQVFLITKHLILPLTLHLLELQYRVILFTEVLLKWSIQFSFLL